MRATFVVVDEDGYKCEVVAFDEVEAAELRMQQIWCNGDGDSAEDMDFEVTDPDGKVHEVSVMVDFEPSFIGSSMTKIRELYKQMGETGV